MKSRIKKSHITILTLLALPVAFGTVVRAQSTPSMMTTYICREAHSGETATAKMVASSSELVCKPFAVAEKMSDGSLKTIGSVTAKAQSGPDFSHALTAEQSNAAYNAWVNKAFHIDPATQHSP